jgi:hypothetical protein
MRVRRTDVDSPLSDQTFALSTDRARVPRLWFDTKPTIEKSAGLFDTRPLFAASDFVHRAAEELLKSPLRHPGQSSRLRGYGLMTVIRRMILSSPGKTTET